MTTKRYRVHGTYIDDYSQTQTTVEMVMASDYDNLQAELNGPSGPTQLQLDKTEIGELQRENARLRTALESIAEYDCPGGAHPRHCDGCAACDARASLIGAPVGSGRL